ncbi:unnamed protein product, partial [marine sediment metagenome]
ALFKPITKYQKSIRRIEEIPDAVHKIFREVSSGRPQPVVLEIFSDAFYDNIEEDQISILPSNQYRAIEKPAVDSSLINESLELLISAKKPLIVSGGGVLRAEAWNELKELAEYLQIPVVTSHGGIGSISNKSKCSLGVLSLTSVQATTGADAVLALGVKFSYTLALGKPPAWKDSQKLIHVDIDPSIIGRSKPITLGIVADCKQYLIQLLAELKKSNRVEKRDWLETLTAIKKRDQTASIKKANNDEIPINPVRLIKEIYE